MPTIELTEEFLKAQIQLNDIAVKAAGLQVAEAALMLSKIYQDALTPKPNAAANGHANPPRPKDPKPSRAAAVDALAKAANADTSKLKGTTAS